MQSHRPKKRFCRAGGAETKKIYSIWLKTKQLQRTPRHLIWACGTKKMLGMEAKIPSGNGAEDRVAQYHLHRQCQHCDERKRKEQL